MYNINIPKREWIIAHQYLDQAPEGTKLPYSHSYNSSNQLIPRLKDANNPRPYEITHSFIKCNGVIYALAQGKMINSVIGYGSMSRVKHAQREDGTNVLIKIIRCLKYNYNESEILTDLSLSTGTTTRYDKLKYYTVMTDLGQNLIQYLENHKATLNDNERLDIAIELCWQVHLLHSGLASRTHTPYAHLDLKPDNVTIDEHGHVHLIDFGLSLKSPSKTGGSVTNADLYIAQYQDEKSVTREQFDIVALKRILYMPDILICRAGLVTDIHSMGVACVLKEYQLYESKLTNDIIKYNTDTSAVTLTALFIAKKLKLNINFDNIRNEKITALIISSLYFIGKSHEIVKTLSNINESKLVSALSITGKINQLDGYKEDTYLYSAINQAQSHEIASALIYLKDLGLAKYYHSVIQSQDLSVAILLLVKINLDHLILPVLMINSKLLFNLIPYLEQQEVLHRYLEFISDNPHTNDLSSKKNIWLVIYELVKSGNLSHTEIITACRNEKIVQFIISLLLSKKITDINLQTIIYTPDFIKLLSHMTLSINNPINQLRYLPQFNCIKAINILFEAKIDRKNMVITVINSDVVCETILLLHSLKLGEFYPQLLDDIQFAYSISRILKFSYQSEIIPGMLAKKEIRDILEDIGDNSKNFHTFKILFNMGLITEKNYADIKSYPDIFEAAAILTEKSLERYLPVLVRNPHIGYNIRHIMANITITPYTTYNLIQIMKFVPDTERIHFISNILSQAHLQLLHKDVYSWHQIKECFTNDSDRAALAKLIYNEEDLAAKAILKNIKKTIKSTEWSYERFDNLKSSDTPQRTATMPKLASTLFSELRSVSSREKRPHEALAEIKKVSTNEFQRRQSLTANIKHLFFSKSDTQKYLDNFANEESFKHAFVNKK